jgi:hypothetical protein
MVEAPYIYSISYSKCFLPQDWGILLAGHRCRR